MRRILHFVTVLTVLVSATVAAAEVRIASWNVRHLGWDNGKDYAAVGEVAAYFDLVAVQEVMSEAGIERMRAAVERRTGEPWSVMSSHLIGNGDYKEAYSFLWRQSAVEFVDGGVVYLDDRNVFAREPFAARFQTTDGAFRFVLASVHAIYGDSVERRQNEARALRSYWDWLAEAFPEDSVRFLVGDFNLPPNDPAWAALREVATPLITQGATTLSSTNGRYANLYDNIWAPNGVPLHIARAEILRFPQDVLKIGHKAARDRVSDHAPVWLSLDKSVSPTAFQSRSQRQHPLAVATKAQRMAPAVIGNSSSKIYHWPGCPGYDKTSARNRVEFDSRSAAEADGYRAARNC